MAQTSQKRRVLPRLAFALLALLVLLGALWLALPRLLGFAAERWLANSGIFPGVSALRVDIAAIDASRARLRDLAATYSTPAGDRLRVELHEVEVDYSLAARKATTLQAKRASVEWQRAEEAKEEAEPWPQLSWPSFPLETLQIDELRFRLKTAHPASASSREFTFAGRLQASASAEAVLAEFQPTGRSARLRLQARPPGKGQRFTLQAKWLPDASAAPDESKAEARLAIATEATAPTAELQIDAPLPMLAQLAGQFGASLPEPLGHLRLNADAELGSLRGTLRALSGKATLNDVTARLPLFIDPEATFASTLSSPLPSTRASLGGELGFAWSAEASGTAEISLQPGFVWRIESDDKTAPRLAGTISQVFTLRRTGAAISSAGEFPVQLRSPTLGEWLATLHTLKADTGANGVERAEAQLSIAGLRGEWQGDALHVAALKAVGKCDLQWSRGDGLHSRFDLHAEAGRVTRSGETPVALLPSNWTLRGEANASKIDALSSSLVVKGEASSPQLSIQPASGAALKVGATRIVFRPFAPGAPGKSGGKSTSPRLDLQVTAQALHYDNWPSADLDTRLRLSSENLRADGALHDQYGPILRFDATQNLAKSCGEATLSSAQTLPDLDRRLQPRPPILQVLSLPAGQLDARFAMNWCAGSKTKAASLDGHGTLKLADTTLGWDKAQLSALQATLAIDGLQPARGRLQVAAARGELATGTTLSDLKLDLALTEKQVDVRALELGLLGGDVRSEPTKLPWPLTEHTLPLEIRHLDLAQLLALLKVEGLSGSGQLDGRLPLTWQAGSVEIDNGLLESTIAGSLKYAPAMALPDNPGLLALRDFRYDQLRTHLQYAADGAYRAQIRLEGHNPGFYNGYPIRFSLNVNGQLPNVFRAAAFSGDFNRHILEQLQSGKLQ